MAKEAKAKESGFKTDHIKDMVMTDDGIEFVVDDDAELEDDDEIEVEGDGDEEEEVDDEIEVEGDEEEKEEEKPKGKAKGKAALAGDVDSKLAAFEAKINASLDAKFDLLLKALGSKKEKEDEEEEDDEVSDEDLADPRKLLGVIEKRVGKTLDKRLEPTEKQVQAVGVQAMFDDAYRRHGEPFKAVSRTVADIMAKTIKPDGTLGMSVDEAYKFVQEHKLGGNQANTAKPKKKMTKSQAEVIRQAKRRQEVDADNDDEVVNTETRTPLKVKGRSIKDTAHEALRLLSRGEV